MKLPVTFKYSKAAIARFGLLAAFYYIISTYLGTATTLNRQFLGYDYEAAYRLATAGVQILNIALLYLIIKNIYMAIRVHKDPVELVIAENGVNIRGIGFWEWDSIKDISQKIRKNGRKKIYRIYITLVDPRLKTMEIPLSARLLTWRYTNTKEEGKLVVLLPLYEGLEPEPSQVFLTLLDARNAATGRSNTEPDHTTTRTTSLPAAPLPAQPADKGTNYGSNAQYIAPEDTRFEHIDHTLIENDPRLDHAVKKSRKFSLFPDRSRKIN